MHGDVEETMEGKCISEAECVLEEGEAKCSVMLPSSAELAEILDAKVQALAAQIMEKDLVRAIQGGQWVLMHDWSDDYANSDHGLKYWNAVTARSDDNWPEGLTEERKKLFLKDKLLVPRNRVEDGINHWHNAQLMHPGREKLQKDLESRFMVPQHFYAVLNQYCKACGSPKMQISELLETLFTRPFRGVS